MKPRKTSEQRAKRIVPKAGANKRCSRKDALQAVGPKAKQKKKTAGKIKTRAKQPITTNACKQVRSQGQKVSTLARPAKTGKTSAPIKVAPKARKATGTPKQGNDEASARGSSAPDALVMLSPLMDDYQNRAFSVHPHINAAKVTDRLNCIRTGLRDPVKLSFVGNFKVGKSKIINSILGESIAPVNVKRSTAVICYFRYGDQKRVRFHFRNGAVQDGGLFDFQHWSDHNQLGPEEEATIREMSHVEVAYPNDVLRDVTLVDTPGFGSETEADDEVTCRHLKEADVVCWVFDAAQPGKADESARVRRLGPLFRSGFALVNKCEECPPSDRPRLREHIRQLIPGVFEDVFLYSADAVSEHEADSDRISHLCMDLMQEVVCRVGGRKDQIRHRNALDALNQLATEQHRQLVSVSDEYAVARGVLNHDASKWLRERRASLHRQYDRRRDLLQGRLHELATQNQARLRQCIDVQSLFGFFQRYQLNLPPESESRAFVQEMAETALGDWGAFVRSIPRQSVESFVDHFEAVFVDQPVLTREFPPLRQHLERIGERTTLSLELRLVDLLSQSLRGNICGFLRTLKEFQNIEELLKHLATQSDQELAAMLQRIIMLDDIVAVLGNAIAEEGPVFEHLRFFEEQVKQLSVRLEKQRTMIKTFIEWLETHVFPCIRSSGADKREDKCVTKARAPRTSRSRK